MRRVFLVASLALVLGLAAAARLDPDLPYLFAAGSVTWWVDPAPLSTLQDHGPHVRRFRFQPKTEGRLEVFCMERFGDAPDGHDPSRKWKVRSRTIQATRTALTIECLHDRLNPAIGLRGPGAPDAVTILDPVAPAPAVRARDLLEPRLALHGASLAFALGLLAACGIAFLVSFVFPPGGLPAEPRPGSRPDLRPWILGAHALLAAWNVATYPVQAGLDAEGHLEAARLVLAEHRIPAPERGFQTYHPPLYPVLGAIGFGLTRSSRALQALTALCGLGLLVVAARALGRERWRGLLLLAFLPVLLVTEPQATNEVLLALLMTGALAVAADARALAPAPATGSHAAAAGLLAGLALLTKYTGLFALLGALAALLAPAGPDPPSRSTRRRLRAAFACATTALLVGIWPYVSRALSFGDPFVGNWDDALGFRYRQPPGYRMAAYFTRFGFSLLTHPFRAREASLWDSLYVSTFGDGFGRFVTAPLQHALLVVLAWLALPLALAALRGLLTVALAPGWPSRIETAAVATTVVMVAAMVRFNLELPYWSTAKGVFLLGLALPLALFFERGHAEIERRFGRRARRFLDLDLALFAIVSALTFVYRG